MRASQCIVFSRTRGTWHLKWFCDGKPHRKQLGTITELPTRAAAEKAAQPFRKMLRKPNPEIPTLAKLVEQYREEKMPTRYSTRRSYDAWLRNYIVPKWGACEVTAVQARPVELWLQSLTLSPRSKASIRGLLRLLLDYAQWRGDLTVQRNPMELVTVKNASKRTSKPRSLTVDEFQRFIVHLEEPFRTIALTCVCFGLRISECLALRWSDVDWLNGKLSIQRGIVRQHVGDVKTDYSQKAVTVSQPVIEALKLWKQTTQFSAQEDWMFASPAKIGRLPWSADAVNDAYLKAASSAGIAHVSTHSMRHTYRSWLDAVGTPIAVQQKLMRHADIRTTMNVYGDVVTDEMTIASGKVAQMALAKN